MKQNVRKETLVIWSRKTQRFIEMGKDVWNKNPEKFTKQGYRLGTEQETEDYIKLHYKAEIKTNEKSSKKTNTETKAEKKDDL